MAYFDNRDVAAIALFSAFWGVSNSIFAPIVFRMFGLPILCDVVGFATLIVAVWWIRKFGAATSIGLIATVINFVFNPAGVHFLGFAAASIIFDAMAKLIGYDRCFRNTLFARVLVLSVSVLSAAVAGLIIGMFFMMAPALVGWGGVLGWAGLHAVGGIIAGLIGTAFVTALDIRGVRKVDVRR